MSISNGIILAGGTGSRLYPLTKLINKHLLPVWNLPMIYHPLNTLILSGIKNIMIVAGREHAGQFLQMLGSGMEYGINLTYAVQEEASGIAQALGLTERFANKDNIVVILGDNIFEDKFDFSDFREGAKIYLKRVPDANRFGIARLRKDIKSIYKDRNDKLIEIVEKPDITKADNELIDKYGYGYVVTGLYLYDNTVFNKINCLKPSWRGEYEITDLNNIYIKEGRMDYNIIDGFWSDAGTMESLYRASSFVRDKIILEK